MPLRTLNRRAPVLRNFHGDPGKSLAAPTEGECIGLVAMIKAPPQFHPVRHPQEYVVRNARMTAVLVGACRAEGGFDTTCRHCQPTA